MCVVWLSLGQFANVCGLAITRSVCKCVWSGIRPQSQITTDAASSCDLPDLLSYDLKLANALCCKYLGI